MNNEVIRPSIIWCDQRTEKECRQIESTLGKERLIEITANPALTGFTLSKILWVQNNEPQNWVCCEKILLPKDYIRFMLTGQFATEVSDASGMQLLDIKNRCWSKEVCDKFNIKSSQLAKMYESCENTGTICSEVSKLLGLSTSCVVAGGAGDQAASAIGNGIVEEGIVSDTLGSSGVVFAHTEKPLIDKAGRVHTFCHAVKNKWHIMGVTQSCGLSIKWFRDNFAQNVDYPLLDSEAEKVKPGSEGVIYLPYLMGERTPHLNPNAKGIFFGLTNFSNRAMLYRAVLEGVCFSQKDCLSILLELGVKAKEVRLSGGASRSQFVCQIFADVFECGITLVNNSEGGCLGVAILAGVAAKIFPDVVSTCKKFISTKKKISPNGNNLIENYSKYKEIYSSLKHLF